MRPAIDIVAEEYVQDFCSRPPFQIGIDATERAFQQVGVAMDVADGVDPQPFR